MICIWSSWCHCHPTISSFSKIQNDLFSWCRLTQVVLEKTSLDGCSSSSSSSSIVVSLDCRLQLIFCKCAKLYVGPSSLVYYPPAYGSGARWMFSAASVCLSVCLFVCLFVCQHDNFQTIKLRMMKLAVRCIVQKSRPRSNVKVKGQMSRSPGTKKRKSAAFFREPSSVALLCRWENQRMLSSFVVVLKLDSMR